MPTLEELDGEDWGEPQYDSYLVRTCHALRKKDVANFTTEDLRIMVGQSISLEHLAPIAIAKLESDPFAQGDFYPGDLLSALIRPANRTGLFVSVPKIESICRRAIAGLQLIDDDQLSDGRFIGRDVARELTEEINSYLNWPAKA